MASRDNTHAERQARYRAKQTALGFAESWRPK
jgi:hypothetical protein